MKINYIVGFLSPRNFELFQRALIKVGYPPVFGADRMPGPETFCAFKAFWEREVERPYYAIFKTSALVTPATVKYRLLSALKKVSDEDAMTLRENLRSIDESSFKEILEALKEFKNDPRCCSHEFLIEAKCATCGKNEVAS